MRRTDDMSIWPWPLILKVTAIVGHTHLGTLSQYQVQILRYGPHGSDIPCDLVTITFNLGGHGACRWCGSTSSICTSTLKFLGLTVRKTWHILCVCVSRPVTLTFDLETGAQCGTLLPILVILQLFVFDLWAIGPTRLRLITWPCDLDLWGHGACGWFGSLSSIRVPSMRFVGLDIRKIWRTMCVSINWPGEPDL